MPIQRYVRAITPETDPEYQKHRKVLDACVTAGVSLPKETREYFNHDGSLESKEFVGKRLNLSLKEGVHFKKYLEFFDDQIPGVEIDLTKLPKGVEKLQIYFG